jgi:hypothetical protein
MRNSSSSVAAICVTVYGLGVGIGGYTVAKFAPVPYVSAANARAAIFTQPLLYAAPQIHQLINNQVSPRNYAFHPQLWPEIKFRADAVWLGSLLPAAAALWAVGLGGGPNVSRLGTYIRGRRLWLGFESQRQLRRMLARECKKDGTGIAVLDDGEYSVELECRHGFAIGGTGSGKTVYMFRLITAAQRRGDKLLVHDVKGDFTAKLPGPIVLLAPQDERSSIWDIAKDVRTETDASELAARLIVEGRDPFWAQAAQSILLGWTLMLMRERGTDWGWSDLAKLAETSRDDIAKAMERHYPAAMSFVEEANAMTSSVIASLKAPLMFVRQLGQAWPSNDPRPRFSFSEWLTTDKVNERTVLFQSAPHLQKLSAGWINAAVQLAASFAMSPALPDNPRQTPLEKQRRIWFVLDELPALKKLPNIQDIIDKGRSKGLRLFAAVQTWEQLVETYGQNIADSWMSMTATLVALYSKGLSAEKLSAIFGDAEYEVIRKSQTQNAKGEISSSYSPNLEKRRVLLPSDFEKLGKTELSDGSGNSGIRGMLLLCGEAFEIEFAWVKEIKFRPESVPAKWTYTLSRADLEILGPKKETKDV